MIGPSSLEEFIVYVEPCITTSPRFYSYQPQIRQELGQRTETMVGEVVYDVGLATSNVVQMDAPDSLTLREAQIERQDTELS
jgi:hypothetical protein